MAATSSVHVADHIRSTLFNILVDPENDNQKDTHLTSILKFSHELKLYSDEKANVQNWIGHLNQCLGATKTRLQGLGLLAVIIDQCSTQVFQQHCASWVRLLMQILQSHDSIEIIHVASSSLATILKIASDMAELSRDLSTNHIPGMISTITTLKPQLQLCSLQVLSACLSNFAGPCGTFKNKLENYLVAAIQSSSTNIALAACKCYILLPGVGGGGTGGAKHTEAWDQCCDKLINTGHGILEQLYQDVETESYAAVSSETVKLASPPETEPHRSTCLLQQFEAICTCVQNLLEEDFPVHVNIPMEGILTMCCRTMAVTGKMLTHRLTTEMTLLSASLPALHSAALSVMTALISSCRGHLIPHGQVINKLFIQALAWTHTDAAGKQKPYSNLRLGTYQCLQTWLEVVGASSGLESVAETLVDQLLQDVRPQMDVTKLSTGIGESIISSGSNKRGKKSKQKGQRSAGHDVSVHPRVNIYANSDLCAAALKVLRLMFLRLGMKLKPGIHKEVHEIVVPLLLQIQQSHNAPPIPYSSGICCEELYRLLLSCVLVPHAKWPAPLHCAIRIFSVGRQDMCIQVASTCAEASVICTNLLHPKVPSLHSSISLAEIKPKAKEVVTKMPSEMMLSHVMIQRDTSVYKQSDGKDAVEDMDTHSPALITTPEEQEVVQYDQRKQNIESNGSKSGKHVNESDSDDDDEDEQEDSDDNQRKDLKVDRKRDEKVGDENRSAPSSEDLPPEPVGESGDAKRSAEVRQEGDGLDEKGESKDAREESKPSGEEDVKGGKGKRKREEEPESSVGKRKAPAEEETTEELSSMLSTFVDSYPDSD
ncbi:proline-, glutamic acid- and leucine-rich protein 1-like [Amphiura filiformis]|uniref:proline-, glutamic acid- and leucine-rich protein 1-like n=1 Tax=Amphiura filiformis TaxID=82378 RepID=UPI003B21711F